MRAPIRMLVSRTTRTRGVYLLVDQVEEVLLVISDIAVLDIANRKVQHAASHGVVDEPDRSSCPPPLRARKVRTTRSVSSEMERFHRVMSQVFPT